MRSAFVASERLHHTAAHHNPAANRRGRPRTRVRMMTPVTAIAVRDWAAQLPRARWRPIIWRNGTQPTRTARFAAVRVTPAHEWRQARLAPEVWLLCEQEAGTKPRVKYTSSICPPRRRCERWSILAHQRWAIEQHTGTQERTGPRPLRGCTYPGWQHHVVLTAVAHAFIQRERMRPQRGPRLTFPATRAIVQEIFTALLFAAKPRYMHWMEQAKGKLQLRIDKVN